MFWWVTHINEQIHPAIPRGNVGSLQPGKRQVSNPANFEISMLSITKTG